MQQLSWPGKGLIASDSRWLIMIHHENGGFVESDARYAEMVW